MTNPKHTDTSRSSDLVKMLRAGDLCGLTLAADRIEALEAENERLRGALIEIRDCTGEHGGAAKALKLISAALGDTE